MKLNFLQQLGTVAVLIGVALLLIYTMPTRPSFDVAGGQITFRDIPEWLPGGALFTGFGLLIVGTIWAIVSKRGRKDEDEDGE